MSVPNNHSPLNGILVINLGGIGDLILSTAALKALRAKYPSARIDLLCVGRGAPLMKAYNYFNTVYVYPSGDLLKIMSVLSVLRKNRYDIVLNMRTIVSWPGAAKIYLFLKVIGAKFSGGRNTDNRGFFFTVRVPETYRGEKPEGQYDRELVELLGAPVEHTVVPLPVSPADHEYADSLLKMNRLSPQDFIIGINPGGQLCRRWPRERFVALIDVLTKEKCKIVLTGSESEKGLCGSIANECAGRDIADLSGLTSVEQLSALIARCKIYISNDTGAMHVCVTEGTPGVFLFGGGNVTRYAPYREPERYVVLKGQADCSPCDRYHCRRLTCLTGISLDNVFNAVEQLKRKFYA